MQNTVFVSLFLTYVLIKISAEILRNFGGRKDYANLPTVLDFNRHHSHPLVEKFKILQATLLADFNGSLVYPVQNTSQECTV